MNDGPVFHAAPRPEGWGSTPSEWLDALAWRAGELWSVAGPSPWFRGLAAALGTLAILWLTGRRRPRTRCLWRRDRIRRDGALARWQCRRCGVDAFTSDGRPPKECKRALREAQL